MTNIKSVHFYFTLPAFIAVGFLSRCFPALFEYPVSDYGVGPFEPGCVDQFSF